MSRYRRKNSFQNTLKDYIVPIIWGILILILLYSVLRGWGEEAVQAPAANAVPIDITFKSSDTESTITYPGNKKETITDTEGLYKGESISVKEGIVDLDLENGTSISLNKIAELKYNTDESFSFYSSDAWFEVNEKTSISMRYADVNVNSGSIISITQNEAGSTVYVLKGSAKVENLWGISTQVSAGQKISISQQNAAKEDIDLSIEKTNIDTYFKESDWFIENEGYLVSADIPSSNEAGSSESNYIELKNLEDEMNLSSAKINISGVITSDDAISIISFDNIEADIDTSNNSFQLNDFALRGNVHDLVVKVFDEDKNILEKSVMTLYTSAKIEEKSAINTNEQWTTIYSVNANDFAFTAPSTTGKFTTTASEITIRGLTSAKDITQVQVNGFTLASFNGSTWRYHAFKRFDNLQEGTNQYRVDYFGEDGDKVYTDYFTIVKQTSAPQVTTPSKPTTPSNGLAIPQNTSTEKLISDEA